MTPSAAPMVVAHLAGAPVEELLVPVVAAGGALATAARVLVARATSDGLPEPLQLADPDEE